VVDLRVVVVVVGGGRVVVGIINLDIEGYINLNDI
jgi:hypothetical protein